MSGKEQPKILVVLPADVIGGAEIQTLYLLANLQTLTPILLTQTQIASTYDDLGIRVHRFDDYGCAQPYRYTGSNVLAYARTIKRVTDLEQPDLIFGLMHNGTIYVTLAQWLYRLKSRVVGSVLGHLSGYFAAIGRKPSLYERWLMRLCFRRLHGVITNSLGVKQDLVEHYGAYPDRLHAIYNGFDLNAIRERSQESVVWKKDQSWLLTACRLGQEKDFDTLLKAFAIVRRQKKSKLVIVGDGPRRQEILDKAVRLGIAEDMILPGFQANPFPWMVRADVFVLSSFYEGFGNVVVEAMALGTPVIASDCPCGPGEIIRDQESGFLVPMGDAEAMAERCIRLLEDPMLRETIAANGQTRSNDFALEVMVGAYEDYFSRMIHAQS